MLLALLACAGPADTTKVRDVQIVHVGVEPAELNAGERSVMTVTVADPSGEGVQLIAWPCTDLGEGCVEDPGTAAGWALEIDLAGEDGTVEIIASTLWEGVFASGEELPFDPFQAMWFLACRPGLCPVLDQALAGDEAAYAFLQDPAAGMVDLPVDGSSLVRRSVVISQDGPEARNDNPQLQRLGEDELVLSTLGELTLQFELDDDGDGTLTTDVYTSVGTLGPARAEGASPEFTWYAGGQAGEGRIYAVVRDEEGGSALWRGDARVE